MALALTSASPALARRNGIASGCEGCHGESGARVTLAPDGPLRPGEEATFTVRITRAGAQTGGLFLPAPESGDLRPLNGEGLAQLSSGLTHSTPRAASGGEVTFRFAWRPPSSPGGVTFTVYAVAADGNGNSRGDAPAEWTGDFVFGCEPQTFYRDVDQDGYGTEDQTLIRCAGTPPAGYAAQAGDCEDYRAEAYPGAVEICNKRDDNCNGIIDEDSVPVELWPDGDGDGFYSRQVGEPLMGCVSTPGYAAFPGDCDDENPEVHPDAEEICNYIDDDCDGRVDERVRPRCGVGMCQRESYSCSLDNCYPGLPSEEVCNGLDDDCDDVVDEGELCAAGELCVSGECTSRELTGEGDDKEPPREPPPAAGDSPTSGCQWGRAGSSSAWLALLLGLGALGRRRQRARG